MNSCSLAALKKKPAMDYYHFTRQLLFSLDILCSLVFPLSLFLSFLFISQSLKFPNRHILFWMSSAVTVTMTPSAVCLYKNNMFHCDLEIYTLLLYWVSSDSSGCIRQRCVDPRWFTERDGLRKLCGPRCLKSNKRCFACKDYRWQNTYLTLSSVDETLYYDKSKNSYLCKLSGLGP